MMRNCRLCDIAFEAKESVSKFCSKSCAAKYNNAIRPARTAESKARTAATANQKRCIKYCLTCMSEYQGMPCSKYCSSLCRHRAHPKKRVPDHLRKPQGGFRARAGRTKTGWFNDVFVQGTYELAFVDHCQRNSIQLRRNNEGFPYVNSKGQARLYYPDFIVGESRYVEVKGWMRPDDELKLAAFPGDIWLVAGDEIEEMIEATKRHYGTRRLLDLMARRNYATIICEECGLECEKKRKQSRFCSRKCAGIAVSAIKSR